MDPPEARSNAGNPLAELAQLVGQDDPFRGMFRKNKAAGEPVATFLPPATVHEEQFEPLQPGETHADGEHDDALGLRPSNHEHHDWHEDDAALANWDGSYDQHAEPIADQDGHVHPEDAVAHQPSEAPLYEAPALTPDLWAADDPEQTISQAAPYEAPVDTRAPRRPLIVLAAVLALTAGGLAATFLSRSGSSAAVAEGATPTIMAASGPTKIKQADGTADTTPEDADAALLNKNGASGGGAVKVVNSQEQPMDLNQLPKVANSVASAGTESSGPFPAPKKVKTFLVRPDGSLVGGPTHAASAPPAASSLPQFASGLVPNGNGGDTLGAPVTAPRPSTPKSTTHATSTPKGPTASTAELSGANVTKPRATNKAVETADASTPDTTAAAGTGGNFALQLAASPNEQDMRGAFNKLQKKYPELSGYQSTVKKVDTGDKTVYRLRVGNLSQDQAKTLCSHLQAGGGSCFVVHN